MTKEQYLLIKLMEECNEVSQRVSKALIFGLKEIQEGQALNNAQRIREEFLDLLAIYDMLVIRTHSLPDWIGDQDAITKRIAKVEKYMNYSKDLDILKD